MWNSVCYKKVEYHSDITKNWMCFQHLQKNKTKTYQEGCHETYSAASLMELLKHLAGTDNNSRILHKSGLLNRVVKQKSQRTKWRSRHAISLHISNLKIQHGSFTHTLSIQDKIKVTGEAKTYNSSINVYQAKQNSPWI